MFDIVSRLPGTKYKVIALLSGGKDSCFNLLHCVANGHELVAVATLQPELGIDELDSHLYQSVGTQVLPFIARALSLPLFTRTIRGKAVSRETEYGSRLPSGDRTGQEGDETEDLTLLLRDVMLAHPEATALASGAILSNYQRLRIEHVCGRLRLVSLAYLWQQPQLPLLDRMFRCEVRAILVKVAGIGLGVEVIGKDVEEIRPLLVKLENAYGSHPAGEGGEYETLTLSTPLFSHRLKITKSSVIVSDPEPSLVAYLKVDEVVLEEKLNWVKPNLNQLRGDLGLRDRSGGLDEIGKQHLHKVGPSQPLDEPDYARARVPPATDVKISGKWPSWLSFSNRGRYFAVSVESQVRGDELVGEELRRCFDDVMNKLAKDGLSLPLHATHVTLLLSSMSDFAPVNEVYKSYFGTSPPSRATVAVLLPADQKVRLEVIGFNDRSSSSDASTSIDTRRALHVQSLSYWAPANIGPYSQAVIANERVHLAGQIPLVPASLTLPPAPLPHVTPYARQAALALQHVRKLIEVLRSKNSTGGGWSGWGESCVAWYTRPDGYGSEGPRVVTDAWNLWALENGFIKATVLFVRAKELPRKALVEFQCNLHTGRRVGTNAEDEGDFDQELKATHNATEWAGEDTLSEIYGTSEIEKQGTRGLFFIYAGCCVPTLLNDMSKLHSWLERAVSVKVYYLPDLYPRDDLDWLISKIWQSGRPCATYIPVLEISDRHGKMAECALEVFGQ